MEEAESWKHAVQFLLLKEKWSGIPLALSTAFRICARAPISRRW